MTDGWVDCPSLGPGWKRREVLRKSGTRSGHSDTYYISPRGEKIRSRVELLRLLGCSRDLTDFDYRRGIFVEPNTEALPSAPLSPTEGSPQRVKKSGKKHLLHLATTTLPSKKPPYLQMFLEPQPSPGQGLLYQKPSDLELEFLGENQVNMQSQQSELPVTLDQPVSKPRKRRYQQHLPPIPSPGNIEDVTLQESNPKEAIARCASCQGQFPEVMLPSQRRCRWLCPDCRAQRRAFNREQRYYKGLECGMCQACKITEDCGTCAICLRKQRPGMKRQWKCLKRRCLKRKKKIPPKKDSCNSKKLIAKWKPTIQRDPGGNPLVRHRESSLTNEWTEVPKSLSLQMPKQEQPHLHPQPPSSVTLRKETIPSASHEPTKECSILPPYIQPEQDIHYHPIKSTWVIGTDPDTQLPAVNLLIATSPQIRQEYAEPGGNCQASNDSLISAGFPQFKKLSGTSSTEVVVLDDSEDNEVGPLQQIQPPVIMEVYSLGGVQPLSQLDSVLREFLAELNEIPLPAHWEVLPPLGSPDLRLVQHSKHSTMSAAVIHIRPGLFFHVVVQGLLVPQEHELYASHPARLTTVDEVVELICDLEAYQLCSGWPSGWPAGERSEACDVLVHSGCCPHCRLNPWPSGSSTH